MTFFGVGEKDDSTEAIADIALDGDLILVVGPICRRLKVSSLLLTNASPVFKAMFGPYFNEGHQLAQPGLTEIELPDDDARAAEHVFNIIHGRNDQVPEKLDADELFQVTLMADKYDCLVSLSFALESWLNRMDTEDPLQSWTMAMVALVLSQREAFATATSALVLNQVGPYYTLTRIYGEFPDMTLQLRTAALLEEERSDLRVRLFEYLTRRNWQAGLYVGKPYKLDHDLLDEFERRTHSIRSESMSSILDSLCRGAATRHTQKEERIVVDPEVDEICRYISNSCSKWHVMLGGLCLRCVQTGKHHAQHK